MKEETKSALGALSGLSFYSAQEAELDEAYEYDARAFERLVTYAQTRENPAGSLVVGARKIISDARAVESVRGKMDDDRAVKRVRAALNYSATALGLIPVAEQSQHLREEFPWIDSDLLGQCLALGFDAARKQDRDYDRILEESEGNKRYRAAMEERRQARVSAETTRSSTVGATAGNDEGEG